MRRAILGSCIILLAAGCGDDVGDKLAEPESKSVQVESLLEGLSYPTAVTVVESVGGGLEAGQVLVGLAGRTGANANAILALSQAGELRRFADGSVRDGNGIPAVDRSEALDASGPFVSVSNYANALGSVAFFDGSGAISTGVISGGVLDASDFGFSVTGVRPPNGSIVNQLKITAQVFLSQPVDPETVTPIRFWLDRVGSTQDPEGTISIAADGKAMSWTPDQNLIPGISYKIKVRTSVKDIFGNGMDSDPFTPGRQQFESQFRISGSTPVLRVKSVNPEHNAKNVARNTRVFVKFSTGVDRATVTPETYIVSMGGKPLDGAITLSSDNTVAIFAPGGQYNGGSRIDVRVTTEVTDQAGNPLDAEPGGGPDDFVSRFTTGSGSDTTGPEVASVDPANGSTAPPQTTVSITFSEPVDPTSVTTSAVRLEQGGTRLNATLSLSSDNRVVTLKPSSKLADGKTYDVLVTTDVLDLAANSLSPTFQSSFDVAATPLVINEVITDPQRDWNDSGGGNGVPFDDQPGSNAGEIGSDDEWVELLNSGSATLNLRNWSLEFRDTSPSAHTLGSVPGGTFEVYSAGSVSSFPPGARVVIGNPSGTLNNDVYIVLRDNQGNEIDDVEIGDDPENDGNGDGAPGNGDGNANSTADEAIARRPDGIDTNNDGRDFNKQRATIGSTNNTGRMIGGPSLPGRSGGVTGIAFGGEAPDAPAPTSLLYFVSNSNTEGVVAIDLNGEVYQISDFHDPRGVAWVPGESTGQGFLWVVHGSSESGNSGVTRMRLEPAGSVGSAGTRVAVGAPDTNAMLSFTGPAFREPVGIAYDASLGALFVANRVDGTVLEVELDGSVSRIFETDVGPDSLSSIAVGEWQGRHGIFLTDSGGGNVDLGDPPSGRLLFFPLP